MSIEPIIEILDYQNVRERANQLGCQIPDRIALLPQNFATAASKGLLRHEREVSTVRDLFRDGGVIETPIENPGEKIPIQLNFALEGWIAPIIFFSFSALTENPFLINITLGIIANYLTDTFKGLRAQRGVKLDVVIESDNGTCKRVHYEGSVEGIPGLEKIVRQVFRKE